MGAFERRVWTELRNLREAESALEGLYKTLRGSGAVPVESFVNSLELLNDRVRRLENLLEGAA